MQVPRCSRIFLTFNSSHTHSHPRPNFSLPGVLTKASTTGSVPPFGDPSQNLTLKASYREGSRFTAPPLKVAASTYRPASSNSVAQAGHSKKSLMEERLLETCPYELKGQPCDIPGGCSRRKICVVYYNIQRITYLC